MSLLQLQRELRQLSDLQRATVSQRFFKTGPGEYADGDQFLGLTMPQVRALAKRYRQLSLQDMRRLLHSPFHEERMLALVLLVQSYRAGEPDEQTAIYRMYLKNTKFINNWDLVDTSAEHIVGAYLRERDRAPLLELAHSQNLWERRIAILATFHFIRRGEFALTLEIARLLLCDEHDLIHKAVGWMLREIGNRNLPAEETFLRRHYRQMPRTMLRYAIERLPERKRLKYLRRDVSSSRR